MKASWTFPTRVTALAVDGNNVYAGGWFEEATIVRSIFSRNYA